MMRFAKTWQHVGFMVLGTALLWLKASVVRAAEEPSTILEGHGAAVHSLAFSPDGKTLASGSADKTVKLWDVSARKARATLQGHTDAISTVVYSPDGKMLASGSTDKSIKLWEAATGKEVATLQGHEQGIACLAYSPDGKTLASGTDIVKGRSAIKLWDTTRNKERLGLEVEGPIYKLTFSPDGANVVVSNTWIKCWDMDTGKERSSPCKVGSVRAFAFSPDGKTLATGIKVPARYGDVFVWDADTGKERAHLYPKLWDFSFLMYSPNGKIIASGGRGLNGPIIWLVHSTTGKQLATLTVPQLRTAVFSPDSKFLASSDNGSTIKLWIVPDENPKR